MAVGAGRRVAVIGGGAAGFFAAIRAAELGATTLNLETSEPQQIISFRSALLRATDANSHNIQDSVTNGRRYAAALAKLDRLRRVAVEAVDCGRRAGALGHALASLAVFRHTAGILDLEVGAVGPRAFARLLDRLDVDAPVVVGSNTVLAESKRQE